MEPAPLPDLPPEEANPDPLPGREPTSQELWTPAPDQLTLPPYKLREFVRDAWHVLERRPYQPNWHIDCLAEHLEACTAGQIRDLIINVPPQTMKSLAVSVFWPAWEWTFAPWTRWLFNSYDDTLAQRDTVKARRLMSHPWYQEQWGSLWRFASDQNLKGRYENDQGGQRRASTPKSGNTGEASDRLVADDPNNVAKSDHAEREAVNRWWDEVMPSRVTDQERGVRVIVQQRINGDDLTGHSLKSGGGWHHLCLPMEYEAKRLTPIDREMPGKRPESAITNRNGIQPVGSDSTCGQQSTAAHPTSARRAVGESDRDRDSRTLFGQHLGYPGLASAPSAPERATIPPSGTATRANKLRAIDPAALLEAILSIQREAAASGAVGLLEGGASGEADDEVDESQLIQPHDDCPIYPDPRTVDGELMWPERFPARSISRLKRRMTAYAYAGQYQQRPVPREGAMFQDHYFRPLPTYFDIPFPQGGTLRSKLPRFQYWDLAWSENQSADYTAAVTVAADSGQNTYVLNAWRKRIGEPRLAEELADHICLTRPDVIGVEKGAYKQQQTVDLVRQVVRLLEGRWSCAIIPVDVSRDKVGRAWLPANRGELQMMYADRNAAWFGPFLREHLGFPKGPHDDLVDANSGATTMAAAGMEVLSREASSTGYGYDGGATDGEDVEVRRLKEAMRPPTVNVIGEDGYAREWQTDGDTRPPTRPDGRPWPDEHVDPYRSDPPPGSEPQERETAAATASRPSTQRDSRSPAPALPGLRGVAIGGKRYV